MNVFVTEYKRYHDLLNKAVTQVSDEDFFTTLGPEDNSIAIIIKHLAGNFKSRFTDFLTTDGEKPWRDREGEFSVEGLSRNQIMNMWEEGWNVLVQNAFSLKESDMKRNITIRGVSFTVEEALARSLAHFSYHVGQVLFLAKHFQGDAWNYLTIPPGGSNAYNQNPTKEKGFNTKTQ